MHCTPHTRFMPPAPRGEVKEDQGAGEKVVVPSFLMQRDFPLGVAHPGRIGTIKTDGLTATAANAGMSVERKRSPPAMGVQTSMVMMEREHSYPAVSCGHYGEGLEVLQNTKVDLPSCLTTLVLASA